MAGMLDLARILEVRARWSGFAWIKAYADTTAVLGAIDVVFGECDR